MNFEISFKLLFTAIGLHCCCCCCCCCSSLLFVSVCRNNALAPLLTHSRVGSIPKGKREDDAHRLRSISSARYAKYAGTVLASSSSPLLFLPIKYSTLSRRKGETNFRTLLYFFFFQPIDFFLSPPSQFPLWKANRPLLARRSTDGASIEPLQTPRNKTFLVFFSLFSVYLQVGEYESVWFCLFTCKVNWKRKRDSINHAVVGSFTHAPPACVCVWLKSLLRLSKDSVCVRMCRKDVVFVCCACVYKSSDSWDLYTSPTLAKS